MGKEKLLHLAVTMKLVIFQRQSAMLIFSCPSQTQVIVITALIHGYINKITILRPKQRQHAVVPALRICTHIAAGAIIMLKGQAARTKSKQHADQK